jgi:2-oxoisovalerate dehydrogenase E1 component alpha subunit
MTELSVMDQLFYDAQRQGRMSFYMTNIGEEAEQVGSSAATEISDVMFGQYREAGAFLWRGFTMDQVADQLFSNQFGHGKGRQMPVHYGSKELNIQTISSPLATQIPQATGAAYALKLNGAQNCVICYFGDGAASEGDFHAALNFAATLECPVLFFCRNNGIAISTQVKEQYRGDGIASRAAGYGMDAIRVDGNDLFAVYEATKAAREKCVSESRPILIEAMSYRGGHHSTSDDSTRYRSIDEISHWREHNNPITRVRLYMEAKGIWNNDKETDLRVQCRKKVLQAISRAEAIPKPSVEELFNDVLDEHSYQLKQQREELKDHLKLYPDKYQTELYESSLK